jgi:hypothetical protein
MIRRRSGKVGTTCDLVSGGRLDGEAGALPLRIADVKATRLESTAAKQTHGIVGIDTVRAATVRDDLTPPRQRGRNVLE